MITFIALIVFFMCLLEIGEGNHSVKQVSQMQTQKIQYMENIYDVKQEN